MDCKSIGRHVLRIETSTKNRFLFAECMSEEPCRNKVIAFGRVICNKTLVDITPGKEVKP